MMTPHPYTQFKNLNQKIIEPFNSIYKEIYNFIKQTNKPLTLQTLFNKFPYLPDNLFTEALKCKNTLDEYSHPLLVLNIPQHPTPTTRPQTSNSEMYITTWNASSINTTLSSLQQLLSHTPTPLQLSQFKKQKLLQQSLQITSKIYFPNTNSSLTTHMH